MFGFIDRVRGKIAQRAKNDAEAYRALILKGGAGDLSNAEMDTLEALAERLGAPLDRIEREMTAVQTYHKLSAVAAGAKKLAAESAKATAALATYRAESDRLAAKRDGQDLALAIALDTAMRDLDIATKAGREADVLGRDNFELLGLEDPAVKAGKRHLVFGCSIDGANPETGLLTLNLSQILSSPTEHGLRGRELVIAPLQDRGEFAHLSKLAAALLTGEVTPADVKAVAETPHEWPSAGVFIESVADLIRSMRPAGSSSTAKPAFNPADVYWIALPGQSQIQLDQLIERVAKAHASNPQISGAIEAEQARLAADAEHAKVTSNDHRRRDAAEHLRLHGTPA